MAIDKQLVEGSVRSKTILFNTAVAVCGLASTISDYSGAIKFVIPSAGPVLLAIGAIGIVLRYVTDTSVRDKVNKKVEETAKELNTKYTGAEGSNAEYDHDLGGYKAKEETPFPKSGD